MDIQIIGADAVISLAVAHNGVWTCGAVAGAYAGHVSVDDKSFEFWGYGRIKNTETLYFRGIAHALSEVFAQIERDSYSATLFVLNDGFKAYLTKYMPKWIANGGKNKQGKRPGAYDQIKECYNLYKLGGLDILRLTPKRGGQTLQRLNGEAHRIAKIAFERHSYASPGSFCTGNGFVNID